MMGTENLNPAVTVLLSVYNGEKYLSESVESILNQTFADFEFIIINDGSTDSSEEIIVKYTDRRIKLINLKNGGLAKALNAGLNVARGEFIARMDADDIAMPHRLEAEMNYLKENSGCVMTGSNAEIIDMKGEYLYTSNLPETDSLIRESLAVSSPFFHSSVMIRKSALMECGGYYEPVRQHIEDFILFNKLKLLGELHNINKPLLKYRITPEGLTNRGRRTAGRMIAAAEKILKGESIAENDLKIFKARLTKHWRSKLASYHCRLGCIFLYTIGDRKRARKEFLSAMMKNPFNISSIFLFGLSFLPGNKVNAWRKFRSSS